MYYRYDMKPRYYGNVRAFWITVVVIDILVIAIFLKLWFYL